VSITDLPIPVITICVDGKLWQFTLRETTALECDLCAGPLNGLAYHLIPKGLLVCIPCIKEVQAELLEETP